MKVFYPCRNKVISIWHLNFRQGLGVENVVLFFDDVILIQDKRRQSVHLVRAERSSLASRHGAIDVIPNRGSVRPPAPHCSFRVRRVYRSSTPCQRNCRDLRESRHSGNRHTFEVLPVASRALIRENRRALLGRTAAGRELLAFEANSNIPCPDLFLGWRLADVFVYR